VTKKSGGQPDAVPGKLLGPDAKVWLDGQLMLASEAQLGLLTHTLHYGYGLFEGIRAYKQAGHADGTSAVFRLRDHIGRMFDGGQVLNMRLPITPDELCEACVEVLRANRLDEGYLRPLAFVGEGRMGIYAPDNPIRIAIIGWKWGAYLGADSVEKGIKAKVSSFTRTTVNASMVRAKVVGQYVTSILAKSEAVASGYAEGILLDKDGYCTEGSGENLFMVRGGILVTPPLSSPILAGITRESVLTLAQQLEIPVSEIRFTRDDLYICDEAFFTGTAAEITPIREVDGRVIGKGEPGPITRRLQKEFFKVLRGEEDRHADWRTVYRL
jgi:branched-chain amino acid aminotransferase